MQRPSHDIYGRIMRHPVNCVHEDDVVFLSHFSKGSPLAGQTAVLRQGQLAGEALTDLSDNH